MADLQGRVGQTARGALQWWLGELAGMIPATLRNRITSLRSRLILQLDETGTRLLRLTGNERQPLGTIDLGSPSSVQRLLAVQGQGRHVRGAEIALSLPSAQALTTTFTLPLAAERNLDQVIGFEFERVVPFKRDEAYYAYRIVSRDRMARGLEVEVTVVRRADVDPIVEAAGRCGLHVTSLEIASVGRPKPAAVILLAGNHKTAPSHTRVIIGGLACLTLLLALACLSVPFFRAEATVSRLSAQVAAARHDAEQSASLERQIEAQRQDQNYLIDRRQRRPTATELLDTLTRLTPDDTWLTELRIDGDEVDLAGASKSATDLLGLIDQSPSFANAAFRASITREAGIGREHFDISAKIVPRGNK